MQPTVTGSAVIAVKFKDGVVLGADCLLSYFQKQRFRNVNRIEEIEPDLYVAATGEYSDFCEMTQTLREKKKEAFLQDDGVRLSHRAYSSYLSKICYYYRNKMQPYMNTYVLAGFRGGVPFLSQVDAYGNEFIKEAVITGWGKYLGYSSINRDWNPDCDEATAVKVVLDAYRTLFLRDCSAHDVIDLVVIKAEGAVRHRQRVNGEWNYEIFREHANEKNKA